MPEVEVVMALPVATVLFTAVLAVVAQEARSGRLLPLPLLLLFHDLAASVSGVAGPLPPVRAPFCGEGVLRREEEDEDDPGAWVSPEGWAEVEIMTAVAAASGPPRASDIFFIAAVSSVEIRTAKWLEELSPAASSCSRSTAVEGSSDNRSIVGAARRLSSWLRLLELRSGDIRLWSPRESRLTNFSRAEVGRSASLMHVRHMREGTG